jgi:hypothetical protein
MGTISGDTFAIQVKALIKLLDMIDKLKNKPYDRRIIPSRFDEDDSTTLPYVHSILRLLPPIQSHKSMTVSKAHYTACCISGVVTLPMLARSMKI